VEMKIIAGRGHLNPCVSCESLLGRRSAEEKVASFLIGWRDRLARLGDATNTVPLPMVRQDIADFLGLTVETVSRSSTKLERDGVIEIVGRRLPAGLGTRPVADCSLDGARRPQLRLRDLIRINDCRPLPEIMVSNSQEE
jgi:hypothetical protein